MLIDLEIIQTISTVLQKLFSFFFTRQINDTWLETEIVDVKFGPSLFFKTISLTTNRQKVHTSLVMMNRVKTCSCLGRQFSNRLISMQALVSAFYSQNPHEKAICRVGESLVYNYLSGRLMRTQIQFPSASGKNLSIVSCACNSNVEGQRQVDHQSSLAVQSSQWESVGGSTSRTEEQHPRMTSALHLQASVSGPTHAQNPKILLAHKICLI